MAEISATIEAEKVQKQSRWAEYFASRAMLHCLFLTLALPAMQQLCGNTVISYYLHFILKFASLIYCFRRRVLLLTGYISMWFQVLLMSAIPQDCSGESENNALRGR
jgi:hypothetical protein